MTQEEIDNTIVDVIFNDTEILHVLEPNAEGVRGISQNHRIYRNKIKNLKGHLQYQGYSVSKIDEFEEELKNNQNQ